MRSLFSPFDLVTLVYAVAIAVVLVALARSFARRRRGNGIWGPRHWFAVVGLAALAVALQVGCSPAAATPVPSPQPPGCSVNVTVNGDGSVNVNGCGNTTVTPSPSPSAPASGGDNTFAGFAIFCYGFGTQPGQVEPNHDACQLPVGYPDIAVTASPKNAKGVDLPNPGDKTDPKVIDWGFTVVPENAASLLVQPDNRFNARVVPAAPRVNGAVFTLTAHYMDPQGVAHDATKSGGLK